MLPVTGCGRDVPRLAHVELTPTLQVSLSSLYSAGLGISTQKLT